MQNHPARSNSARRKKMAIVTSYLAGETYGLLGPQLAATLIAKNTLYDSVVLAVAGEDDPRQVKKALYDYFGAQEPIIGFSYLSGRTDLFRLAGDLKAKGATTFLAGPQADVDFFGETGCRQHTHRFQGLARHFSFALHGPAEQILTCFGGKTPAMFEDTPGVLFLDNRGHRVRNPENRWNPACLTGTNWHNLYRAKAARLVPVGITSAQVVQQIGCPYAARENPVEIDYPAFMPHRRNDRIRLSFSGCSFCDVATDKGMVAVLETDTVIRQINSLPQAADGRKIPFELINENPLPGLPGLLDELRRQDLAISRINLTLRADWLLKNSERLRASLETAREMGIRIVLSSIGFESFSDTLLRNLNKGLSVATNLAAVHLIRQLKNSFPDELGYLRREGGNHGFIHPTPWDTAATEAEVQSVIAKHDLDADILPNHSTPLIIQHASGLGDWIREVEAREKIRFPRYGSIVAWWDDPT